MVLNSKHRMLEKESLNPNYFLLFRPFVILAIRPVKDYILLANIWGTQNTHMFRLCSKLIQQVFPNLRKQTECLTSWVDWAGQNPLMFLCYSTWSSQRIQSPSGKEIRALHPHPHTGTNNYTNEQQTRKYATDRWITPCKPNQEDPETTYSRRLGC